MTTLPDIPGVKSERTLPSAERWDHRLIVTLPGACEGVSSAPLNGGFGQWRHVVNRSVPKTWRCDDPEANTVRYVAGVGLEPTTVGLITAVSMADLRYAEASRGGCRVYILVTAGASNAAAAGGMRSRTLPRARLTSSCSSRDA